ncbi:hypothetical protein R50345_13810 [Paenibacillus sp. FSL R5-0345]|uniref:hypothetical protein n=1 Tax=Paenibacillus sp. FSL R5-0345 TaxID=1536770 RepID=UPI0004F8A757|nr:hypothetical protein [Paenibacillus sp. FSL R5-0345]AIQ35594.1 hypothetical protein R50345_13810 [Paenibacillus sp. FSL R5-0345]
MNVIDTLPEPEKLKKLLKILSSLNIVLCTEEWLRYHRFVSEFDKNVSLASIDNGSGDDLFIIFAPQGTIIKGFDHESEISPYARDEHEVWPGIYEEVPTSLLSFLEDEAINKDDVTFCIWRENNDLTWQKGKVEIQAGAEDGSDFLLGTIFVTAEDFVEFAEGYFEITLPLEIIAKVYEGAAITKEMIEALNPDGDVEKILRELAEIDS